MPTTARLLSGDSGPRIGYAPAPALTLVADFKGWARRLQRSAEGLTSSERQFLKDFQRDRYPLTSLEHFADIAAKSPLASHQFSGSEILRAHVINRRRCAPVALTAEALDAEDQSNSLADIAARAFERHPTPATRDALRMALEQQLAETRCALDTLNATPVARSA